MTGNIDENFPNIKILVDEPLSNYTNTKTGGNADYLVFPNTIEEIQSLIKWSKENCIECTIIGNASNLIVQDGGIRGLTLILTNLNSIKISNKKIVAEAGAAMIKTAEYAYEESLTGLEFAAGIPGSIGGAIFMNAGAYGGEVSESVSQATVLTRSGKIKTLDNKQLDFGYRHSSLQDHDEILLSATFSLKKGNKKDIRDKMDELNYLRASKQPLDYPSCGSVFKRPTGYFTGKLIHEAGLQGYTVGGAQVSMKHAGFIVNIGGATATDYILVIKHIQEIIKKQFHVQLDTEVRIIGEEK